MIQVVGNRYQTRVIRRCVILRQTMRSKDYALSMSNFTSI